MEYDGTNLQKLVEQTKWAKFTGHRTSFFGIQLNSRCRRNTLSPAIQNLQQFRQVHGLFSTSIIEFNTKSESERPVHSWFLLNTHGLHIFWSLGNDGSDQLWLSFRKNKNTGFRSLYSYFCIRHIKEFRKAKKDDTRLCFLKPLYHSSATRCIINGYTDTNRKSFLFQSEPVCLFSSF